MKVTTKEIKVYIAKDGKEFETESACLKWERNLTPIPQEKLNLKLKAFEYSTTKFIEWHNEKFQSQGIPDDFIVLKLMCLNYLLTIASSSKGDEGLLSVFDNFWHTPSTGCEQDIYENLKYLINFEFDKNKLTYKKEQKDIVLDNEIRSKVDSTIDKIKKLNKHLVYYSPMILVTVCRKQWSFTSTEAYRKSLDRSLIKISNLIIQNEDGKFFGYLVGKDYLFRYNGYNRLETCVNDFDAIDSAKQSGAMIVEDTKGTIIWRK